MQAWVSEYCSWIENPYPWSTPPALGMYFGIQVLIGQLLCLHVIKTLHLLHSGLFQSPVFIFCLMGNDVGKVFTKKEWQNLIITVAQSLMNYWASLVSQLIKYPSAMQETLVQFLGWKDPLEEGMATHLSILAWRIPWTEEPGGLQGIRSQRVGHNWALLLLSHFSRVQLCVTA